MAFTIRAPLNTQLGYGHAGWNITKQFHKNDDISLFAIGNQAYIEPEDHELIQDISRMSLINFDKSDPCILCWHEFDLIANFIGKGQHIAFPFFEINELDDVRRVHLNNTDHILVASDWAKEVLENNGIFPDISVVRLGVDKDIFYPKENQDDVYRFFTIGKIEKRKCTELLSDVFAAAFDEKDNVELHVLCDSPLPQIKQQMAGIQARFNNSKLADKITIHNTKAFDKDLANFIRQMDCGLFLTRAEGFGLPILQSLSCGKQVITTDYSAHSEFANSSNSHVVHIEEMEPAIDNVWFHGLGTWAKLANKQIEECVEHMRTCYKNNLRVNTNGVETASKMSWENTVTNIKRAINNSVVSV